MQGIQASGCQQPCPATTGRQVRRQPRPGRAAGPAGRPPSLGPAPWACRSISASVNITSQPALWSRDAWPHRPTPARSRAPPAYFSPSFPQAPRSVRVAARSRVGVADRMRRDRRERPRRGGRELDNYAARKTAIPAPVACRAILADLRLPALGGPARAGRGLPKAGGRRWCRASGGAQRSRLDSLIQADSATQYLRRRRPSTRPEPGAS
jgi:hypothetical protein